MGRSVTAPGAPTAPATAGKARQGRAPAGHGRMAILASHPISRYAGGSTGTRKTMTLCIWPVPPDRDGDGAAQRAWYMLNALARVGPVDLVILGQADRPELERASLEPARTVARSVRFLRVPEWSTTSVLWPRIPRPLGRLLDQPRISSVETPRLSRRVLARIAAALPDVAWTVFVGRLSTACIVDDLCRTGLLRAGRRFVDFDDIMSRFRRLHVQHQGGDIGRTTRWWQLLIAQQMEAAEARIARTWDGCGVASHDDVAVLEAAYPGVSVTHLPNVVERDPAPMPAGPPRLLFVGNLAYPPNVDGLRFLLEQVWPIVTRANPAIGLTVVGRGPDAALTALIRNAGADLHVDVPSVAPFYAQSHAVAAPIFFGGGTRVKIVEAMAFGKPIVSTPFGVEGLGVSDGEHVLLGETAAEIADAVLRLAADPALRAKLGRQARALQQSRFGSGALDAAVRRALRSLPGRAAD